MANPKKYWDEKIAKYAKQDWADKPSLFAEHVIQFFPKQGKLLELGSGYGNDGLWFSDGGYDVTQLDLDDFRSTESKKLNFIKHDLAKPLAINDKFNIVYAHLSLHYFNTERTKILISELHNLLEDGGMVAFLVNSTADPEMGEGERVEENYHSLDGIKKRYFDIEFTQEVTKQYFKPLLLDDNGTSYKDKVNGMVNLIRFVGRKK